MKPKANQTPTTPKYVLKQLSRKKVEKLLKEWGTNAVDYAENNHGTVYWNEVTGEILWKSNDDGDSNSCLLNKGLTEK